MIQNNNNNDNENLRREQQPEIKIFCCFNCGHPYKANPTYYIHKIIKSKSNIKQKVLQ